MTDVIVSDDLRVKALREGITASRGNQFVRQGGQDDMALEHPVNSYGSQYYTRVDDNYSGGSDMIMEAASMLRPWESMDKSGAGPICAHYEGKDAGRMPMNPSQCYDLDSGKYSGGGHGTPGTDSGPRTPGTHDEPEGETRMSKNDRV